MMVEILCEFSSLLNPMWIYEWFRGNSVWITLNDRLIRENKRESV